MRSNPYKSSILFTNRIDGELEVGCSRNVSMVPRLIPCVKSFSVSVHSTLFLDVGLLNTCPFSFFFSSSVNTMQSGPSLSHSCARAHSQLEPSINATATHLENFNLSYQVDDCNIMARMAPKGSKAEITVTSAVLKFIQSQKSVRENDHFSAD